MRPAKEAQIIWHTEERRQWEENPPLLRPDPDCEECGGSGVITTTDNPDGHFDSQLLCYDLEVSQYDPALDANLRLPCANPPDKSCALEEQPEEVLLQNFLSLPARTFRAFRAAARTALPTRCDGCLGYGERLRWAEDWKNYRISMLPVSWLDECPIFPYAVVSPDGEWHHLDVIPFGCDEATIEQMWSESVAEFEKLIEENASCYVGACYVRL